jgi:hypothetical protein
LIGKGGDDTSIHTDWLELKPIDDGPNLKWISVVSLPIGIWSCRFSQCGVITD